MEPEQAFDRKIPAIIFIATSLLLALHHWYATTEGEIYVFVVFVVPMFWALGLGGLIHPPLVFAIGSKGRHLPASTKAVGFLFALGGLVAGYFLATRLYGF
jgi:hypothetical protein